MTSAKQRIAALRELMAQHGFDAYFIPSADPHQSEYLPDCWQRRRFISGFTGSAGDLLVARTKAGLWTDGRYFLQAEQQLKGSGITLFKQGNPGVPTLTEWLGKNLKAGQVVGADPRVLSSAMVKDLEAALDGCGATLSLLEENLVDLIWGDEQPRPSKAPIEVLPTSVTGLSARDKLKALSAILDENRADALVLVALDAIAWLFNIRSSDVLHNPVAIAYALVKDGKGEIFIDLEKVTPSARKALGKAVTFHPYDEMGAALKELAKQKARVMLDSRTANAWVTGLLKGAVVTMAPNPVFRIKARKNPTEVEGIRNAHVRDGVAMVRFLCWLEQELQSGGSLTELTVVERLKEARERGEHYRGESFSTIAGYGPHGAIIHYDPTPETASPLRPEGILLLDSGGQYIDGTTDITRTLLLGGNPTAEQKDRYTRVLRGHIALASLTFPAGLAGRSIEAIARVPLFQAGLNYNHGTGHGVGHFLSVHEGPQSLSPTRCVGVPLEAGNVLSIEPGYYKEGEYGIRIENLYVVVKDEKHGSSDMPFLAFEALTLCPIETRLIDRSMLTGPEKEWLNTYHRRVNEALRPYLSRFEIRWLGQATRAI